MKFLLGLGVIGLAIGGYILHYSCMRGWYMETDANQGMAIFGLGVLLFALGLAGMTNKFAGIGVGVLLAAIAGFIVFRASSAADERRAASDAKEALARSFRPVCENETGIATAADLKPAGSARPTVTFMKSSSDGSHFEHTTTDEKWFPATAAAAQLVVCMRTNESSEGSCQYEGGHYVSRYRYTVDITVREAKTAKLVAATSLRGTEPPECSGAITERNGTTQRGFYGSLPGDDERMKFLRPIVEGLEKAP